MLFKISVGRDHCLDSSLSWPCQKYLGSHSRTFQHLATSPCSHATILSYLNVSWNIACVHAKLPQSCPTLCECSPPGSSVHGILQARILEWVAMPSSRRSFPPRNWTHISGVSCLSGRFFIHCATWETLSKYWAGQNFHLGFSMRDYENQKCTFWPTKCITKTFSWFLFIRISLVSLHFYHFFFDSNAEKKKLFKIYIYIFSQLWKQAWP